MTDEPRRGRSSRDAELEALRQKSLVGTQRESLKTAAPPEMTLEKWQLQQRNFTEEERRKRSDASAYLHSYREKNVPIGTNKTPSRRTEFPPGPDEQAQIGSSTDIKGIVAEFEKSISVTTPTSEPIHNSSGNPLAEKIAPQDNSLPICSESQPETLMVNNNLNSTNAAVPLTEETPQTDFSEALQAEEVITTEEYSMTTAQLVYDNLYQENESKPQPDSILVVNEEPDVNAELTQTFTQKELEPASIEAEPHQSYLQTDPSTTSPVETEGLLSVREREPQYDDPHLTTTNSPVEATECPLESQVDPQADATSSPVKTTDVYSPEEPQMNLQPEATSSPVKPTESYLPVEPQIAPILELPRKQVNVKVLLAVHVKQTDADAILVGGQQSILDSVIWVTENIVKNTIATSACLDATGTIYDSKFPPTITSVEADNAGHNLAGTQSESITRLIVRIIVTLFQLSDAPKRDRKEVINEVAHALREAVAGGGFAREAKALRRAQKEG